MPTLTSELQGFVRDLKSRVSLMRTEFRESREEAAVKTASELKTYTANLLTNIDERFLRQTGGNSMRVNCLSCGHKVDLDHAYDDYEGQVKCFVCGAILEVKTESGEVKSVKIVTTTLHISRTQVPEFTQ